MLKRLLITVVALAALVFAGTATAATYKVAVGELTRPPAGAPMMATLNQFFPSRLVIHAKDKVTFTNAGFHTVTYWKGGPAPAIFMPAGPGVMYDALNDAAGSAFVWSALPKFIYNAAALAPTGGLVIDGSHTVSSGILQGAKPNVPGVITFTFPKTGTYKLFCLVHGSMMSILITVKPASATIAKPAAVIAKAKMSTAAAWASVTKKAAAASPPSNTVWVGLGAGADVLGYFPQKLTVKAGTTVTFQSHTAMEPHDVAFGPADYIKEFLKTTDLIPFGPGAPNQVSPAVIYGSDPGKPAVYDGTNHGNGFFVSPLLGTFGPLARQTQITFTKPGTYHYICLIHGPDMSGDIVVTP